MIPWSCLLLSMSAHRHLHGQMHAAGIPAFLLLQCLLPLVVWCDLLNPMQHAGCAAASILWGC